MRLRTSVLVLHRSFGGLLCSAALAAVLALPVHAFKPNDPQGHRDIVREALRGVPFTTRDGVTIFFDEFAIEAIAAGNAMVDDGFMDMLRRRCAASNQEFCKPEAHCDDELLPQCSDRVSSIRAELLALRPDSVDVDKARRDFGRALHTIQDFYSHSNWVNRDPGPGQTRIQPELGKGRMRPAPAGTTCDSTGTMLRASGLSETTSGYFVPDPRDEQPAGKCLHGTPVPFTPEGIHKDDPGRPFFREARALAVMHTRAYVQEIFSQWDQGMSAFMQELAAPRGTLGVIVDETGSMDAEVSALRGAVAELVRAAQTLGPPDRYLVGPALGAAGDAPLLTREGAVLEAALAELEASPREGLAASPETILLQSIAAAPSSSALFFYTDRCAVAAAEFSAAAAAARAKQTALHVVLSQTCPDSAGPHLELARQTGGQLLRSSEPQSSSAGAWMRSWLAPDRQIVLQHSGRFAGTQRVLEVPVDGTIAELTVSASADSLREIRVFDPRGVETSVAGLPLQSAQMSNSAQLSIPKPALGTWTVRVSGSGALDVQITARSPIGFGRFDVVEERGRYEGSFFPIEGPAQAGAAAAEAAIYGPAAGVAFELRTMEGRLVQTFRLAEGKDDYSRNRFQGPLQLPVGSFRVYARGVDSQGTAFLRAFPAPLTVNPPQVERRAQSQ